MISFLSLDFSASAAQGISDHERQLLEEYSLKEGPIDERHSKVWDEEAQLLTV